MEPFRLEAAAVVEPLDKLLIATGNKLEREWPSFVPCHDSSPVYLRSFVAIGRNVFRAMQYFCADKPPDPDRRLEYSLAAAPLARVVLEAVFNVTFLLEDLPARTQWFEKAGFRAQWEDLERFKAAYGTDPAWAEYLKSLHEHVIVRGRAFFRLTPAEFASPKTIPRWPTRSGMRRVASPALADHLQYLGDWFYKHLSEDAHVNWMGVVRLSAGLLQIGNPDVVEQNLQKLKINTVQTTIVLLLALVSEIEISLKLGLGPGTMYLWRLMNEGSVVSKELYARRYEGRL